MLPIGNLLRLLVLALELWVLREARREQRDLESDEQEIHRLRNLGDPISQLRADRLLARALRSAGVVSRVNNEPTTGSTPVGGSNSPNEGRPVDTQG